MSDVLTLIERHGAALAVVKSMNDGPDGPEYDAAVLEEIAALEALAEAPCGSEEGYARKLAYLLALADVDEYDDRLTAIVTAGEEWLRERAKRAA
jgi:hypothetical protein